MKNFFIGLLSIAAILLFVIFCVMPAGIVLRPYYNTIEYVEKKIDENTKYESKKKVEDTCRSMISSYESDKLVYEQYKDNDNEEKRSWADQAKMRANKTASTYNNYILENSFVWENNVPKDINNKLDYLE